MIEELLEAEKSVEQMLNLEDVGWIKLGGTAGIIPEETRRGYITRSRIYAATDPLAKQSIRLWTDYTFGTGVTWAADDERVSETLSMFWDARINSPVLSPRGQRRCSDKLLIDGEVFFAVFPGREPVIRTIDPLEITEIITDPDDYENVRYFKREWTTPQAEHKTSFYRSFQNEDDETAIDWQGRPVSSTEDALVYHVTYNAVGQRGLPLLTPALDWIKLYRQFLGSRAAVMLALARFAWKLKVQGGQTAVDKAKAAYNEQNPAAGSVAIENMGADLQPIRADSGATSAYQDGRMLKLQVCAAVGWPEQYMGDVSVGNLATAKTVELPVQKMCQSYQAVWKGVYEDIDQLILEGANIPEDKWYVDRDFPAISPEDAGSIAANIAQLIPVMPELASSKDVLQSALMSLGITDTASAIEQMTKENAGDVQIKLARALREFREAIKHDLPQV